MRQMLAVAGAVVVLLGGCSSGDAAPAEAIDIGDAQEFPGQFVEVQGMIIADDGVLKVAEGILLSNPPGYHRSLNLTGLEAGSFDLLDYPFSDIQWGDIYEVTGVLSPDATSLVVETSTLQSELDFRKQVEACWTAASQNNDSRSDECSQTEIERYRAALGE